VWEYHLAADVIVFPYRQITQSAALISAMAFGRAVIATDIGGLPETVDGNGWIVPRENPSALCAAILEAAENRDRTQQMGYRSSVLIAEKYAGSIIAQRTIQVYEKTIG
jgi:glycosyltransferase involved in cell wall biosynthesis